MTTALNTAEIAERLSAQCAGEISCSPDYVDIAPATLADACACLKNELGCDYMDMLTAVDYPDRFEMIYHLLSLQNNTRIALKVRLPRDNPSLPSLSGLWLGAVQQEREVYDLFGITFSGHPDLRRIVLWEGYEGHPLRKDFKDKAYAASD